ncbi:hypothetical protein C8R46DRAFT_981462 [Mycena filopes]|nr:hypothetical protein C8R46DRAFT_981462 [Mycena filopes]
MEFAVPRTTEIIDIADDSDDEGAAPIQPQSALLAQNLNSDFEDSDDEDENDEVEQKPLIAPSTEIREDFEAALAEGFDFDGVFAYSQRYAIGDAPNPCLNIDGLGAVGIPLSERDARAIIAASLTGDGANTTGSWELPAEKIRFSNPAWDTWIQKTTGVAASTALTAYTGASPSFALKKLVVQETSPHTIHYKEPIDDDESNMKIGDFIVVLPGTFEGAQLQLRHAGQTKSLNFSHQSGLSTSVIAAYSGVEHTLSAVSSGYRLSLVYDIVQPITHAEFRPTLPEMQGATQKLHNIMLSWKQDAAGDAPQFLACLLQHKYPRTTNFRDKSLTGADALLLSHLHPLARELKFRIYLAHIDVTIMTPCEAEDDGYEERQERRREYGGWGRGRGRYGRRRYEYGYGYDDEDEDEDEEEEIDEMEFEDLEEEIEETLTLTQVVDLRGMPVAIGDLGLEPSDLLNGTITDQEPDRASFARDPYERTTATRTQSYKRTVLLIWPKDNLSVGVGDVYQYACNALKNSLTVSPTEREKKIVDQLLDCCRVRPQEAKLRQVLQVLRESADRWNDVQTFLRAVKACGVEKNTDLMGPEAFVSAYQAFGWAPLKDFYTEAMAKDESNTRRQTLLARLTQMAREEQDDEVAAWCNEQVDGALRSLSKMDAAQVPWLTALGLSRGGEFLRDVIFPQLHAQKLDKSFWIPFIQQLQLRLADIPTTSPAVVQSLIAQWVAETVRTLPAFPLKVIPKSYAYGVDHQDKNSDAILEVVKLCITTKNDVLCGEIFKKMREAAARGTYSPSFPPWLYYAELSPALVLHLQSVPPPNTLDLTFRPFFFDVIDSLVSAARISATGQPITPCPLTDQHKSVLMMAARKAGGITVLQQRLNATTLKGHDSNTVQALVRSIVKEFPQQQQQPADSAPFAAVVVGLVRVAIDTFDTATLKPAPYSYYNAASSSVPDQMLRMVQFCFDLGAQSQCQRLLLRFLNPPPTSTVAQHVSKVLAPFLPVLRQYLVSKRLDLQTEPYKLFAAAVVKAFATQTMAQKPTEVIPAAQLQAIGCRTCAECQQLRAFFLSDRSAISFARVQGVRTHLARELSVPAVRSLGLVQQTIRSGSPHTLQITKPASMTALGVWTANSQTGKGLLAVLGDATAQMRVLGADYAPVHARIYGTYAAPAPAALPLTNANNSNAQKRAADVHAALPASKKMRS